MNEYCHGSRAFYPLPNFSDVGMELTRVRLSSGLDWYDVRCGAEWGHYRATYEVACYHGWWDTVYADCDRSAVAALLETRLRQRADLVKELAAELSASPGGAGKPRE